MIRFRNLRLPTTHYYLTGTICLPSILVMRDEKRTDAYATDEHRNATVVVLTVNPSVCMVHKPNWIRSSMKGRIRCDIWKQQTIISLQPSLLVLLEWEYCYHMHGRLRRRHSVSRRETARGKISREKNPSVDEHKPVHAEHVEHTTRTIPLSLTFRVCVCVCRFTITQSFQIIHDNWCTNWGVDK